nr:VWA domain-containing protein [Phycisphaerales bacterium]
MTFLAPWAGIIGAAIGVPLLVSLYLLKLRRKPLKVSSVLLWEQAVQDLQANVPLRWLRWSWLMLLQLAALGCLLAAMARPTIAGGAEMGSAARAIIVIDASASMSARDGGGGTIEKPATRLDEAKRRAVEFVEQLRRSGSGSRAQAMVIAFGREASVVQGFTGDARALGEAIEGIGGTDEVGRMDDVVRIAGASALAGVETERLDGGARTAMVVFS